MITIRKLSSLRPQARLRKAALLLQAAESDVALGREVETDYLHSLGALLARDPDCPESIRRASSLLEGSSGELARRCNALRHAILAHLRAEPGEWDFKLPGSDRLDPARRTLFPIALYLDDIRSPFNVGAIFRSAESFAVSRILLSEGTPLPTHPRAARVAMGCEKSVAWSVAPIEALEGDPQLFALEVGGTPLDEFPFPAQATAIIGSEELGVSPRLLALADSRLGRVSIPLAGAKRSLNVSTATGILLYRWASALSGGR